jgi:hypothetical protein
MDDLIGNATCEKIRFVYRARFPGDVHSGLDRKYLHLGICSGDYARSACSQCCIEGTGRTSEQNQPDVMARMAKACHY